MKYLDPNVDEFMKSSNECFEALRVGNAKDFENIFFENVLPIMERISIPTNVDYDQFVYIDTKTGKKLIDNKNMLKTLESDPSFVFKTKNMKKVYSSRWDNLPDDTEFDTLLICMFINRMGIFDNQEIRRSLRNSIKLVEEKTREILKPIARYFWISTLSMNFNSRPERWS